MKDSYRSRLIQYMGAIGIDVDVPIRAMHAALFGEDAWPGNSTIAQQQLGAPITRANRVLELTKIVPGEQRRTYRLTSKL